MGSSGGGSSRRPPPSVYDLIVSRLDRRVAAMLALGIPALSPIIYILRVKRERFHRKAEETRNPKDG